MQSRQTPWWAAGVLLLCGSAVNAQDWPPWRGPNRDAKTTGFKAPKTWPKELTQKWKVTVGDGVATPALVGDKLYVFTRQRGGRSHRCLDAATGKNMAGQVRSAGGDGGPRRGFQGQGVRRRWPTERS